MAENLNIFSHLEAFLFFFFFFNKGGTLFQTSLSVLHQNQVPPLSSDTLFCQLNILLLFSPPTTIDSAVHIFLSPKTSNFCEPLFAGLSSITASLTSGSKQQKTEHSTAEEEHPDLVEGALDLHLLPPLPWASSITANIVGAWTG